MEALELYSDQQTGLRLTLKKPGFALCDKVRLLDAHIGYLSFIAQLALDQLGGEQPQLPRAVEMLVAGRQRNRIDGR